jgi:methionyl aminopeptidase
MDCASPMQIFGKLLPTKPLSAGLIEQVSALADRQGLVLAAVADALRIGMSTAAVAELARGAARQHDVNFSFRDKLGFPDDISVCLNNEVMNGVPGPSRVLKAGDVLKISIGAHRALAAFSTQIWTLQIGAPGAAAAQLLGDARDCLLAVEESCTAGNRVSRIAAQIDDILAAKGHYSSREFAGHAIGAEPIIEPLFTKRRFLQDEHVLAEGSIVSLLVLAHQSKPRLAIRDDKWTTYDRECYLSACYSHMLRITSGAPQRLTHSYPVSVTG